MYPKDAASPAPIDNHREREKGVLVYPVYSRRSGGLSIGINLFPDQKKCNYDCPYCEVFPFSSNAVFSLEQMEHDLKAAIAAAQKQNIPIKDICFSGNGEPSLSPHFPDALKLAGRIRGELAPSAELVLITNGMGLLQLEIFFLLGRAAGDSGTVEDGGRTADDESPALVIWLKLDAGTPDWYEKINRPVNGAAHFGKLITKIKEFAACAPVTIQTMICAVDGESPPLAETQAWEQLMLELAAVAANGTGAIRRVQIYGKARPAPEDPKSQPLPVGHLENRAASLRRAFEAANADPLPLIEVYP